RATLFPVRSRFRSWIFVPLRHIVPGSGAITRYSNNATRPAAASRAGTRRAAEGWRRRGMSVNVLTHVLAGGAAETAPAPSYRHLHEPAACPMPHRADDGGHRKVPQRFS